MGPDEKSASIGPTSECPNRWLPYYRQQDIKNLCRVMGRHDEPNDE
jgi:hypothetical protein